MCRKLQGKIRKNSENTFTKLKKNLLLQTAGLISTKLGTKHYLAKRNQVYSNEGPRPFSRGDIIDNSEIH